MRYAEARMAKLSMELLHDIEKDTVTFTKNFDESLEEQVCCVRDCRCYY